MKSFFLKSIILLVLPGALFFSCVTEEPQPTNETNIIGTWNVNSVDYSGTSVTKYLGLNYTVDYTGMGTNIDASFTFNEDKSFSGSGTYDAELTITSDGLTYDQTAEDLAFAEAGSWSVDGDKITLTSNDETSSATIISLTDTELELKLNEEQTQTINGSIVTITVELVMKLSKN